jgi:hypothetical protein
MSTFNLKTAFTDDQLEVIHRTGTNVIVAKPSGGTAPNVAWQVFKPWEDNTLSWTEDYGIYASTASLEHGAELIQLSSIPSPAESGLVYTLEPSGIISGPASGGTADSFTLVNKFLYKSSVTVGLYQDAVLNGTEIIGNALSAAPVLLASTSVITPYTTVYIWLQSEVISNTVVTTVTSPMTRLKFGDGIDTISVKYDSLSGKFVPHKK